MSDFLSKFSKDKYEDLLNEQEDTKDTKRNKENQAKKEPQLKQEQASVDEPAYDLGTSYRSVPSSSRKNRHHETEEDIEIDPDYRRKKRRRIGLFISGAVMTCILIYFIYYIIVHVEVDDFIGHPVAEAREWASENDVEIELIQEYDKEYDTNQIILQSVPAGDKIKKGQTLQLTSSLGPDPEEVIPLPDFSEMNQAEAEIWIEENKAMNLQVVTEYSDDIEEGGFINLTIRDSGIDASEYQRKDSAAVYYSRGEEVFEKNITVPNFIGSPKADVENWAENNEIDITYEETDSDSIEVGHIISQSVAAEEKIAKRDKMEVVVSLGEATVVPNFSGLTAEEAMTRYPDLNVAVKEVFHSDVAYGGLISQSIEPDTKLLSSDDHNVTVTYSLGKPYLRDVRGNLEGDLPKIFFDEYQSKGADIKYIVKYVDSPEIKGTVVDMGKFNEYVPLKYTVEISVSNNASVPINPPAYVEEEPPKLPVEEVEGEVEENVEPDEE